MIKEARRVLTEIDASYIDPQKSVDQISFEDRKLIEVAMAMYDKPDILILDETTTALSQKGRKKIYSIIDKMKREGKTVIFISHDLKELQSLCDNITILRDGCLVQTLSKNMITIDKMRSLMIGRDLSDHYYREDLLSAYGEEVVLQVDNITFGSALKDISFMLHKGEILGIGGLTDCGMHELCKIIFGLIKPDNGKVTVLPIGSEIKKASEAVNNKIAFIPKNREQEAMMPSASIKDNIVFMSYDKLSKGPYISPTKEIQFAKEQANLLNIKMVSINQFCLFLSGGNKQKVVISKWIANDSKILIMDCPTRGIDVGVKAAIYELMEELVKSGKSIIMVSEELPELLGMSDRIIILKDGILSAIFKRGIDWNEEKVIQAMI
ncbi:MAG: ATP-binding cassette domain-containing protein [Flexilinea sp.]